ncbi:hypothetical protein ACS0TY_033425 [Phlomoides rotata]
MNVGKRIMSSRPVSKGSLRRECENSFLVLTSIQLLILTPKYMCGKKNTKH